MRISACVLTLFSSCASVTLAQDLGAAPEPPVVRQIVFMTPIGNALAPGPGTLYEIAVINVDGSGFQQLTNDGLFKFLPHFSPDGTKIAYTKFAVGQYGVPNSVTDIAVYDLASGRETVITHQGQDVQPTWSPRGDRIAFLNTNAPTSMWTIDPDGSNPKQVSRSAGTISDMQWGDIAWSSDNWILFSVAQNIDGCFKVRVDKIRPDGSARTQVTDGGPNCTPAGFEQSGDADPGWSADASTIYSSRGFPVPPVDGPANSTERKVYAFSSDAWFQGKPELDLSLASEPSCIEGVPKGSPDGRHILLFRICFDTPTPKGGIYVTDTAGSYRAFIAPGFGPDWNPVQVEARAAHRD
jgi:dipeptidyl aminopeptidase/acylaminoacyl peptidase